MPNRDTKKFFVTTDKDIKSIFASSNKIVVVEKDKDIDAFEEWFSEKFGNPESKLIKRITFMAWDASRNYHLTGKMDI